MKPTCFVCLREEGIGLHNLCWNCRGLEKEGPAVSSSEQPKSSMVLEARLGAWRSWLPRDPGPADVRAWMEERLAREGKHDPSRREVQVLGWAPPRPRRTNEAVAVLGGLILGALSIVMLQAIGRIAGFGPRSTPSDRIGVPELAAGDNGR